MQGYVCKKCRKLVLRSEPKQPCTSCGAINNYIKTNLSFDDFFNMTPEEQQEYANKILLQNGALLDPMVKCPYCGSPNTDKISTSSRMLSVGFFGLGSSKAGKQWHCNKCGSNF